MQQSNTSAAATGDTTAQASTECKFKVYSGREVGNFQSPPQATSRIDIIVNVDSASEDKTVSTTSPFTAMFDAYDANLEVPISDERYAYQTTIKVYDENGSSHNLTVYMDPVANDEITEVAGGKNIGNT